MRVLHDHAGRRQSPALLVTFVASALFIIFTAYNLGAATVEDVALSKLANRQSMLEDGARKEGKLLWYTTLIVNQALGGRSHLLAEFNRCRTSATVGPGSV